MKVLVYSAIYGGYDELKEQIKQRGDFVNTAMRDTLEVDFLMITDGKSGVGGKKVQSESWHIFIDEPSKKLEHPRMQAKYWKTHPHKAVKLMGKRIKYDATLWIDGSVVLGSYDTVDNLIAISAQDYRKNGYSYTMFKHPDRVDIYTEANYCKDMLKYKGQDVIKQVTAYKEEGMPAEQGLYACTIIYRAGDTKDIDKMWWAENKKHTYQDQLSLPYVFWKLKKQPTLIKDYQYRSELFDFTGMNKHRSEL